MSTAGRSTFLILARTASRIVLFPPYVLPASNTPTILGAHTMSLGLLLRVFGFLEVVEWYNRWFRVSHSPHLRFRGWLVA